MTTEATTPTIDSPSNEHEDPSLSSASLCIRFHLLGESFGPVFTHQAFSGEIIRGYHPPLKKLVELRAQGDDTEKLLHSSHAHHEAASKELSIDVHLSPSCQVCQVKIDTEKKRLPRRQSLRASKRMRVAVTPPSEEEGGDSDGNEEEEKKVDSEPDEVSEEEESASEPEYNDDEEEDHGDENEDDSEFEVDDNASEVEDEGDKEGTTRKSRKPTKEILQSTKKGLPTVIERKVDDRFLRKPLGVELKEYSVGGKYFVLCLATGAQAAKFHTDVQRLALWFIETADDVDVASSEGGFWKVLYLLQRHKRTQYSLAGYTTLFHFHAPFKKPKAGYVVRICQSLVLPPYQRSGHGKQMLTCVLDIAHGQYMEKLNESLKDDEETVEINVEAPAPAFVMLRNRTDFDCFVRSIDSQGPWYAIDRDVTDDQFFTCLPESETVKAAAKAKIIPRQIQIVEELYKLQKLHEHLQSAGEEHKEELEKRFRLMLKKRLNKENREHLSGFRTKVEKQEFLEEEYQKCLESYRATLRLPKEADQ